MKSPSKVLVVDDSRAFVSGLKALLSGQPFEFISTNSPKEALSMVTEQRPDIIVTDLDMPDLHGFDFIKQVRTDPKNSVTPILVLTGSTDTDSMSRSIECGADAFCAKESIRYTIGPQLQALLRLRETYEEALRGKQLGAVQALIGTYKHEFGNALAIMDGMLNKVCRAHPEIAKEPAVLSIKKSIDRFHTTLSNLNSLREYKEQDYTAETKILKVS